MVLYPPFTAVRGLEEMFPILSSPRLNQFTQGALRLPLWVRLRESKLLSQRKRQRNSNTYPPCQTATLPHNFLPLVTPWRSLSPQVPFFLHHQRKPNTQWIQVTKSKHLDPQHHFLHRLLKRQNAKSLEVFQEQGFSFSGNPALLAWTREAWLTWQICFDSPLLSVWSWGTHTQEEGRRIRNTKHQKTKHFLLSQLVPN